MTNNKRRVGPKRRWARRIVLFLIVFVVGAVGSLVYVAYDSVAPLSGTYTVEGLTEAVTITTDDFGRPFVHAKTLNDALFAEGWLHASHRYWQMELFRRAGTGRLAELLGSGMVDSDKELWRMGVPQLGKQLRANTSAEMLEYVTAYVSGVNGAIASGAFAVPELLLLQAEMRFWTVDDVYAMGALMAFQSANNANNELLRLALFDELGEDRAQIFLPHDGNCEAFPYVVPTVQHSSRNTLTDILDQRAALEPLDRVFMPSFAFGSNGWVVAPKKSKSGDALFAFDSHDTLGLPNLFYEVHLFFGDGRQIRGWSVAGLPGVINGYNERIAWGFTNIGDTQDLFIERRSDSDPLSFKDGDTWYKARTELIEIPVSGRDGPEMLTLTYTKNGPLISEDPPIALRWTIQDLDGMSIDSILDFNLALNWDEYTKALDGFAAPTLNATYADIDGNIGFRTAGLLPVRGAGSGLFPIAGDVATNRWQGFVPSREMPELANPDQGFLAAANARVNADGNGIFVSADNAPGYRIRRLNEVFASRDDFTVDDMRLLQMDWYDRQAELLMPTMMKSLETSSLAPLESSAHQALANWTGRWTADAGDSAPLIFQAWYRSLAVEVFKPTMSESLFAQLYKNNYPLNHALDHLILDNHDSSWWRDSRVEILRDAFTNAVAEIQAAQGDDIAAWRLDAMHHVKLEHELGKAVPQLSWLFNAEPAPWGGSVSTIGRARYRYDRAYDVTAAATMRVVGAMRKPLPEMEGVIPGGQSGHPLSRHYKDQFSLWLEGIHLPIPTTIDDVSPENLELIPLH